MNKNRILLGIIIVLSLCFIPLSVSAAINITHTTSQSTIAWTWTGNDVGISNITVDTMEICGFSPSSTSFFLSDLDPVSTHTIIIKYVGEDYSDTATTENATWSAGGYSNSFSSGEAVRINQSSSQDPSGGKAEPWILWVLSGCIGLILVAVALLKPRAYHMDYEINIILSVMAWPFLWYWTWGGLTSVDYIAGTGMAAVNGASVMITQHIYYSYPILGWIGIAADLGAVFVTILLIGQFKLFKEIDEEQNGRSVSA